MERAELLAREEIARRGQALTRAGLTPGSSGNISVRVGNFFLISPTNARLGELDPANLAKIDFSGAHIEGMAPSKEFPLHMAMLRARARDSAVVHLHSTHAVAVSCMEHSDHANLLPPLTAYFVMRVGALALAPYHPPGDAALATAVERLAHRHHAVLLSNHGPVVCGDTLDSAASAIEELEETAKLYLLLQGRSVRPLSDEAVRELAQRFPS